MPLSKIPPAANLQDAQFFQIEGPDGLLSGFQYDQQQRALYAKESQIIYPSFHGHTHIAEDPIPIATADTIGLMSAEDKYKLDSMLSTRIGILGFQGSGFPDDAGWMSGDLIFAAGTEFISIERVGNIIRFTVDSPVPLSCNCEACSTVPWVQDETSISAIRPPTCSGKMPGINTYGEMKTFIFPESAIFDPSNPQARLNQKDRYPSLIFKRYTDGIQAGGAEYELVLKRDPRNLLQSEVGWAMTPGALGIPECVWFTGKDTVGNQLRFDLAPDVTPGLMGGLLYKGSLITKKQAVITDYTTAITSTNQYRCRWWDTDAHKALGDVFTATNIWQYASAENPTSGMNPQQQILDISIDLLPIGTIVEVFYFKVGEVGGTPINRYYFTRRPELSPQNLWTQVGTIRFGDLVNARSDTDAAGGTFGDVASIVQPATRCIERTQWGFVGFDEPLIDFYSSNLADTEGSALNQAHRAVLDPTLPGLRIMPDQMMTGDYSTRPVSIWNRTEIQNSRVVMEIGRPGPTQDRFSPIDILLTAPIDSYDDLYVRSVSSTPIQGYNCLVVKGANFRDLPPFGTLRILTIGANQNKTYRYSRKLAVLDGDQVALLADYSTNTAYPGSPGDVLELLHEEYDAVCVRLEFQPVDDTEQSLNLQFKVGVLDMSKRYENELIGTFNVEDYVRGLGDGYTVSSLYTQEASFTGVGTPPASVPVGFVCYDGGAQDGGDQPEYWNKLEIMHRGQQVWIWWNGLLIAPSGPLSNALPFPVSVTTPYFPVPAVKSGKVGVRLWPGATMRSMEVRTNSVAFSEFAHGQLVVGS